MAPVNDIESLFSKAVTKSGLDIGNASIALLSRHCQLLVKWNATFNLTALENPEDIIDRLYIDSLLFSLDLPDNTARIHDIGSGPGFPGIPLLIIRPEISLTIVEPRQKMHAFFAETAFEFKGKPAFEAIQARCDDNAFISEYREKLSCVISKGFAPLPKALAQLEPLIPIGGCYITCVNPETRLECGIRDIFVLESEKTHILPLTKKPTRHLIFRRKS